MIVLIPLPPVSLETTYIFSASLAIVLDQAIDVYLYDLTYLKFIFLFVFIAAILRVEFTVIRCHQFQ